MLTAFLDVLLAGVQPGHTRGADEVCSARVGLFGHHAGEWCAAQTDDSVVDEQRKWCFMTATNMLLFEYGISV